MARTKKTAQPPQSAEDVGLAEATIAAAFDDTIERRRADLAKAEAEVLRLQGEIATAEERRTAWVDRGEIDADRALDAHMFAVHDMHDLARRVLGDRHLRLDPDKVDAARRKRAVVERYLTDRSLLPAALVDPNWRPNR
jgi:hypothetical protein